MIVTNRQWGESLSIPHNLGGVDDVDDIGGSTNILLLYYCSKT
jgi:hypothetical protein